MKYIFSLGFIFMVFTMQAAEINDRIIAQVKKTASVFGDGKATLNMKSLSTAEVIEPNQSSCVTLVSFFMEGFSGGNNSSQFIVFLNCQNSKIMGVHPFSHHKNKYEIKTATYNNRTINISSPKGEISFTNKYSIWWSQSGQISP